MHDQKPSSNQDHVTANAHRSALRIGDAHLRKSNGQAEEYFATYLAVRGDAAALSMSLKLKQRKVRLREASIKAAVIMGVATAVVLATMIYRQHFVIVDYLGFMLVPALFALFVALATLPRPIRADGIEITADVYDHLTAHDRDILFSALAKGPGVYSEALQMLAERYEAEARQEREREVGANQAAARSLFEKALFDPNEDIN